MSLREEIAEANEDMLFADGYDEALIGYIEGAGTCTVAVYDKWQVIEIMINRDGMTEEDALDHFYYNVVGSYVGENTPVFLSFVTEGSY